MTVGKIIAGSTRLQFRIGRLYRTHGRPTISMVLIAASREVMEHSGTAVRTIFSIAPRRGETSKAFPKLLSVFQSRNAEHGSSARWSSSGRSSQATKCRKDVIWAVLSGGHCNLGMAWYASERGLWFAMARLRFPGTNRTVRAGYRAWPHHPAKERSVP